MSEVSKPVIAVIGGNNCSPEQYSVAQTLGANIAGAGAVLLCGGLSGIMEAASRGAFDAGGETIGILPGTEKSAANPYIKIALPSGLGIARNVLVVQAADAVIACAGKYGTMSEISLALQMGKPVISLAAFSQFPGIHFCNSPAEAVQKALLEMGQ